MTITSEEAAALIALAAALECCHKLNMNVIGRGGDVSLMIRGQHRVVTHTLDHRAVRSMCDMDPAQRLEWARQ